MESLIGYVFLAYLIAGIAGLVWFNPRTFPTNWPQLDHPSAPMRVVNRVLAYALCNAVAGFLILLLLSAMTGAYGYWSKGAALPFLPAKNSLPLLPWLLLCPILPATGLLVLMVHVQRSALQQERNTLRKNGVLPPVRLRPDTPLMDVSRGSGFDKVDLHDEEMVRELARGHWKAIARAMAAHGNVTEAAARQSGFLDKHLSTIEPALARHVKEIYVEAGTPFLEEMARVAKVQRGQEEELLSRRESFMRNAKRNLWLVPLVLFITLFLLKKCFG